MIRALRKRLASARAELLGIAVMASLRLKRAFASLAPIGGGTGLVALELATMSPIMAEAMGATLIFMTIVLFGASANARIGGRGGSPF